MEKKEMIYGGPSGLLYEGEHRGYKYYVVSISSHMCGYVAIPKGHRLFRKEYDEIDVTCHGGLTYSSIGLPGFNEHDWVIGWDYSHSDDLYYGASFTMPGRAWTTDEVISECISVIDQISKED